MPSSATAGHRIYNATNSTTSTRYLGQSFDIAYAAGTVYGTVWEDTLWVDGSDGSIGVTGNPVECAQNIGGAFSSLPAVDGIMGLNTWINDSEIPEPQETWLSYILSHLAGESLSMLSSIELSSTSIRLYCCPGAKWGRNDGFRLHWSFQICGEHHIYTCRPRSKRTSDWLL